MTGAVGVSAAGARDQSLWLDDLRRGWLQDGTLHALIEQAGLQGVTTNPTIFARALSEGAVYAGDISQLRARGRAPAAIYEALAIQDVRQAADLLLPTFRSTQGRDGFVSIELSPELAHDVAASVGAARRLWSEIARPNVMIKVPATAAGIVVIRDLLAQGIHVNATLLFGKRRLAQVLSTHAAALEMRLAAGLPIDGIAAVASFFVSRIDAWVDAQLRVIPTETAAAIRGRAGIAAALLAHQQHGEHLGTKGWLRLAEVGGQPPRLLWASMATKDAAERDVRYVEGLRIAGTVATLPLETLRAFRDHGDSRLIDPPDYIAAERTRKLLASVGVDLAQGAEVLEEAGVAKFLTAHRGILQLLEATGAVRSPSP